MSAVSPFSDEDDDGSRSSQMGSGKAAGAGSWSSGVKSLGKKEPAGLMPLAINGRKVGKVGPTPVG